MDRVHKKLQRTELRGSKSFQGSEGGWYGCRLVIVI